jgi:hypothetical protein
MTGRVVASVASSASGVQVPSFEGSKGRSIVIVCGGGGSASPMERPTRV